MRTPRSRLLPLLLLAASLPALATAAPASPPACPGAGEFAIPSHPLTRAAAVVASGKPLNILAIGSATTAGDQANGARIVSFPHRMLEALRSRLPSASLDLTVTGRRGITAEEMLPLLRDALARQAYPLVLWQTGTVEAVRGLPPDRLRDALDQGTHLVRSAGGDVVLIDPQYSRFLRANTNLDPYADVMMQAASQPNVAMFHRFDLTRTWALDGRIDMERAKKSERDDAMMQMTTCLGEALANFIANGIIPPAR